MNQSSSVPPRATCPIVVREPAREVDLERVPAGPHLDADTRVRRARVESAHARRDFGHEIRPTADADASAERRAGTRCCRRRVRSGSVLVLLTQVGSKYTARGLADLARDHQPDAGRVAVLEVVGAVHGEVQPPGPPGTSPARRSAAARTSGWCDRWCAARRPACLAARRSAPRGRSARRRRSRTDRRRDRRSCRRRADVRSGASRGTRTCPWAAAAWWAARRSCSRAARD